MNDKPIEDLIYDFLEENINAAVEGDELFEMELHDTIHKKIEQDNGIRISDAESDLEKNAEDEIQEFDGEVTLVFYSKILGKDKTERSAAKQRAFNAAKMVVKLFKDDNTLGNRVCNSRTLTAARGFDSINSKPYAVINLPVIINESGQYNFNQRRR